MASTTCSATSPLRILAALLFIPAFPLCLVHGILKHHPVPALGLLPQFFSIVAAAVVLGFHRKSDDENGEHSVEGTDQPPREYTLRDIIVHPVAVFCYDVALASGYMIVLVFTWITTEGPSGLSMLAAYATIPLLASLHGSLIHLFLALQAVYHGLAIHSLVQWVAWRAVPPNCPNCNVRLRTSFPDFPWLKYFRARRDGYAAIPAMEEDRYRDEADEENGIAPREPEAVDIISKNRKGKGTDFGDDSTWEG
ncbi:nucleosome binding protein [Metarhizium brunneum]